jgi:hypothetical protein
MKLLERELVVCRIGPKNAGAFSTSRHVTETVCFDVIFDFAHDIVEFASSNVALHLLVPFIVFPTVKPRCKLGALFKRELLDCSFDLGQAHQRKVYRRALATQ